MVKTDMDTVCCIGARTWALFVAKIQLMMNLTGLVLVGMSMYELLSMGQKGFDKSAHKGRQPEEITKIGYQGCVAILAVSMGVFFISVVYSILLFRGIMENKTSYMKSWIFYAVVCYCWLVFETVWNPTDFKIGSMVVFTILYLFGVYVVRLVIRDIEDNQGLLKERVNPKTKLLGGENFPSNFKYTVVVDNV